jgi:catechol 2,3-dioxygenase-like lactoylglutathione lyase family enzyme
MVRAVQISKLAFIAFPVADLDRSSGFYSGVLRCPILERANEHADFELGGVRVRTYLHRGDYRRQHSGLQFFVDDIDAAEAQLAGHIRGPVRTEAWGGRVATVAGPDGNLFDFVDHSWRVPANPLLLGPELLQIYKQTLNRQFEASLAMLNACVAACPEQHWEGKIANGSFRWVAYHALFFVDLYLSTTEEAFRLSRFASARRR